MAAADDMGIARLRAREANRGFAVRVAVSIGVHAGLFGGVLFASSLAPRRPLDLNAIPVELVALGKERDERLLPRKVRRRAAPPARRPEAQIEAQKAPPQANAVPIDRTKTKPKPSKDNGKRASGGALSDAAKALLEGSELDEAIEKLDVPEGRPDGSPLGTTTDPKQAATEYEARVQGILKSRYQLPLTVPPSERRFLQAEVILFIGPTGRVTRYEFLKSHPNQPFMNALEGLLRSVELPPPPEALRDTYRTDGLAIRFKP